MKFVAHSSGGRLVAGLIAIAVSACGGGGSDGGASTSSAGPKAEGAYSGTFSGSANSTFQLLVLENDEYWALYGRSVGNTLLVEGFIEGSGSSSNGSFAASNAKDYGTSPPVTATVAATYVAGTSIQGAVTAGGQTTSFSGTAIPASTYNYAAPASIGDIQGAWNLTSLDGDPVSLTITGSGAFTGSSLGCSFSGTFSPRASGKNVFDFAVTFGAAPCALPGQSGRGIAVSNVLAGTATRQLIVAGVNASRTAGTALFGTR